MNVTGVLLALTACIALLTRSVLPTPFVQDVDASFHGRTHISDDEQANIIHRERRDAEGVSDGETGLSRLRRQVAQMAASNRNYSNTQRGRRWGRSRLLGRQRYQRERAARGNVHNW